jgi:hypothetical protein
MLPTRLSNTVVIFHRPFILDGFGAVQPAGNYSVEIEEEGVPPGSERPGNRLSTKIRLTRAGVNEYLPIDPDALQTALERDNAQMDRIEQERIAKSRHSTAKKLNSFNMRLWK